jgi:hypothetical protein
MPRVIAHPAERVLWALRASGAGPASLDPVTLAPRARNAIPPHVADENPERETEDQNSIDQSVEHGSAS